MGKLDPQKLALLPTYNERLDEKYGKPGTLDREQFNEESIAWFYGDMLRERNQELKLAKKEMVADLDLENSHQPCDK